MRGNKMKSDILDNKEKRTEKFQPNDRLETLIHELSKHLTPVQNQINDNYTAPKKPVLAVIGCPRSGTTFMTQLLEATGAVSYPSNLLSRFAYAPYVGALIQRLLLDPEYDLGGEFSDLRVNNAFSSNVGKTSGAVGINEFFHFWRKFLPNYDPGYIGKDDLDKVDIQAMKKELGSIEAVFEKPIVSKAMMLQYNLDFFAKKMPEIKFIYIKRNPKYLMQSVKQARLKYYDNEGIWWSVKPKEYSFLKDLSPDHQVAGQVLYTHKTISMHGAKLSKEQFFEVAYEDVCRNPKEVLNNIAKQFDMQYLVHDLSRVADTYKCGNSIRLSNEQIDNLQKCYAELELKE